MFSHGASLEFELAGVVDESVVGVAVFDRSFRERVGLWQMVQPAACSPALDDGAENAPESVDVLSVRASGHIDPDKPSATMTAFSPHSALRPYS